MKPTRKLQNGPTAARSVLDCGSPSAFAARHSAAPARRRLLLFVERGRGDNTGLEQAEWVVRPTKSARALAQSTTWRLVATLLLLTALLPCARATVTNVAWYRLGENDPGATSGLAVTGTTTDLVGANHLRQFGGPLYTSAVSADAASRLGSSLAVQFNGASQFLSNALVSTAANNFGIEAWVKPNGTDGASTPIAYNGAGGNGWGLLQSGNRFSAAFGGVTVFDLGPVAIGTWTHLALVRDGGTNKLYFNGSAVGTSTIPPNAPTLGFELGFRVQPVFVEFFNGAIDEARVFHFAPGQFSTNDLLVNVRRVATLPVTSVGPTNATLNGSVNPVGFPTSVWFEWGNTTNYGNITPPQALGSGNGPTNFSEVLSGLFGGTHHFRAVASNSAGIVHGSNQSFTTPIFTLVTNLTAVAFGSVAWGDYDNDGRLDILLTGGFDLGSVRHDVWRNTGNGFTRTNAVASGAYDTSVAWGDFNNDGRLDILLIAGDTFNPLAGGVFQNFGSTFGLVPGPPPVFPGSVAWGDYDNDGRLDILLTGATNLGSSSAAISQIWRNVGSGFVNIEAGLPGVSQGSAAWGDYDNDERLDILLTGQNTNGILLSQIWRNTGGGFTNIKAGLPGVSADSSSWADYDNDGRLDILLTGFSTNSPISQIWRNTGHGFTNINAGLPGVVFGSAAWGDYDNDGRLDILLTGTTNTVDPEFSPGISQIWRNTATGFTNIDAGLPGVLGGSVAWGDYDNDGRLDILLAGPTNGAFVDSPRISQIWRNNTPVSNTAPTSPTGLSAALAGNAVVFSWSAASDAQTPASGLTYNLRVGTTPGGADLVGPMAANDGLRRLPQFGNAQHNVSRPITGLPIAQPLYWSVQAVDSAFAGSAFATETSFTFNTVFTPPSGIPVPGDINGDGVVNESELNTVLSNYFPNSPFLQITNVAGLGGTNVTFALTNSLAGTFSVEFSTNLFDWLFLGPATTRYEFTDTNAPAEPQRYYRLRWP